MSCSPCRSRSPKIHDWRLLPAKMVNCRNHVIIRTDFFWPILFYSCLFENGSKTNLNVYVVGKDIKGKIIEKSLTIKRWTTVVLWVKNLTAAQVTVEAWVQSSALCSELRIQHCFSCSVGHSCSSDSIPGLRTSTCHRCSCKKQKQKFNMIAITINYIGN